MRFLALYSLALLIFSPLVVHITCTAQTKNKPLKNQPPIDVTQVKPHWNVGDQWVVQTETRPFQERNKLKQDQQSSPVQWQFQVTKIEKIAGAPAYRVEISGGKNEPSQQPQTTLWIDQQQGSIRQIQTQIPVQGGFRTITESYTTQSGQPAPVIGPLSVLPLDLPLFQQGTKSSGSFQYQSFAGPAGTKAVGEVSFTNSVEQQFQQTRPTDVKKVLGKSFIKSLDETPTINIRLKGDYRQVQQIWQKGVPWPLYSDNGSTTAKLLKFTPAKQ